VVDSLSRQDHPLAISEEVAVEFSSALDAIVEAGVPAAAKRFGSAINAEWVDEALRHTGTMSVRRRRLPARLVVWLVIAMALFRDCAIRTVAMHLGLSNPWGEARRGECARTVAASAVSQSRQRLGDEAMQIIFDRSAHAWAEPAADSDRWRGLSLWGMDGSTLNVPDTVANEEAFGLPGTGRGAPAIRRCASLRSWHCALMCCEARGSLRSEARRPVNRPLQQSCSR